MLRAYGLFTFTDNLLTANYGRYNILLWIPHLWTISYEEQFYAIIPWFLRFIFKRSRQNQFLTLGILFLVGSGFRVIFIAQKIAHPAIWVLPITHFDSILFGLAVGLGLFDIIFRRIPTWVIALAGILGLYVCTLLPNVYIVDWSLMALYPLVGFSVALLVHSTLCAQHSPATAWLRWRPFAFLGKISYGLYLFHWVAIEYVGNWVSQTFAGKNPHNQMLLAFALALAVTLLMGTISYITIEKPFLKMKSRFTIVQSRPV